MPQSSVRKAGFASMDDESENAFLLLFHVYNSSKFTFFSVEDSIVKAKFHSKVDFFFFLHFQMMK